MPTESQLSNDPVAQVAVPTSPDRDDRHELKCVTIWGVPLAQLTCEQALDEIDRLIQRGKPAFFITANLNYVMLSNRDKRLRAVNEAAAFLVADGMPLVWYSRLAGETLPERIAGADLIYLLCQQAAERGYRVYLLGGGEGVAEQAAGVLQSRHPSLQIVGTEAPMLDEMSPDEHDALVARIRRARPDLLLAAFGQPKGEIWLAENCQAMGVPACVQLGASFDFVAGRTPRAPRWIQRIGAEWLHRIWCEPGRMVPRYSRNAVFLITAIARDLLASLRKRG